MKKIFSLMMTLMAVFSLSAKTLYLAPNADWKTDNARFAVYAFGSGEAWYSMTAVQGEDGLYQAAVDDKYTTVIFCRMNPATAENTWDNKWNQTNDMTIDANNNLCNITGWSSGEWAKYEPAGGGEGGETPVDPEPPTTENRTIYLNGGGAELWNQASPVFFVHAWGGTAADVKMTQVEGDVYSASIPADNTSLTFVRMASGSEAIDWDTKWNQSNDQTIPADKDLFTMTSWSDGTWSKYEAAGGEGGEGGESGEAENVILYSWNGVGVTTAADASQEGGEAEAVQADGTNIVVGANQRGNWCLKANKGFNAGKYYLGIALDNAVNAGDTIRIAYFRTGSSSTYVLGMDFNKDKESVATTYQILTQGDPQVLAENGDPVDSIFIVPEGVENAKYVRIYRNSGSTGLWVAKFELVKKVEAGGGEDPIVVDKEAIYFVNVAEWANPRVHLWDGTAAGTEWPGVEMTKEEEKINTYDVYKYEADKGAYAKCIFSNNGENQTANLTWTAGKYFYESKWYDKEKIPVPGAPEDSVTLYMVNNLDWATANAFAWEEGVAQEIDWPGKAMTKTDLKANGKDVYSYKFPAKFTSIIFNDGAEETTQTVDLVWDDTKPYFVFGDANELGKYSGTWYASIEEIPAPLPDAVPLEGNIWKVTAETPVVAGSHYINEALLKMDGVYKTTLKTNTRTIAGEEFTHAIQVRTDGYPSAENKVGAEKSGSTSLVITAKENVDVTFYYNRQVVGEGGTENDNKDLIVFDQAAITTKMTGTFTVDQVLDGNAYLNATKTLALQKGHVYTVTASGTTLQLHGIKLKEHTPVMQIAGTWKMEGEDWIPQLMVNAEDNLSASIKLTLEKKDYDFKVISDGNWLSQWGANDGQYEVTRSWMKALNLSPDAKKDLLFKADEAGEYTFQYVYADSSLYVTFPDQTIDPNAKYYMRNNWNGGDWAWKEMTKQEDGTFKLENVVFGGNGVNYNTAESEEDMGWVALADFQGAEIGALDTVTLVLDPSKPIVTATLLGKYVKPIPVIQLAGTWKMDGEDWIPQLMVNAEDNLSASIKLTLEKKDYDFKVISDGNWLSQWGANDGQYEVNRSWMKALHLSPDAMKDLLFKADEAGEYTFQYVYADSSLYVTFPDQTIDPEAKYYMRNNWNGAEEWTWKEMTDQGDGTYALANVVFGGTGVDLNTAESETGKIWVAADEIEAMDMTTYEMTSLGALDTVAFVFDPDAVNSYTGEKGVSAFILGKYVAPAVPENVTLYYVNDQNWENVNAYVWGSTEKAAWPGEAATKTELKAQGFDVYSYTFPENYTKIIFNNGAGGQTTDFVWNIATPYCYKGEWFASIDDIPAVVVPAKFYIIGNEALVAAAGKTEDYAWNPGAIKVTEDSYTFENLAAGDYRLQISTDGTWGTSKGYAALTDYPDGLEADGAYIKFTLKEASNVKVTYKAAEGENPEVFKVEGKFYVPVYAYTIAGDSLLMGSNWSPKDANNEMVYDAEIGAYKLEKKNVVLGVHLENYYYKVVRDHEWGEGQFPADNSSYPINVTETGIYTLTFIYNPKGDILSASAKKTGDLEKDVTLYFVKKEAWEDVYAYFWIDKESAGYVLWPGEKMTLTEKVLNDVENDTVYPVYTYSFPSKFTKVIFNNGEGGTGNQTADMNWNTAKPYYYDGVWYESLEAINPAAETKFYITGNEALVGAGNPWDPKAIKSLEDSYTLELAAGTYEIGITLDGTNATFKAYADLTAKSEGVVASEKGYIKFTLTEAGNVVVTYKVVDEKVTFSVTGTFYTIEDGYYLAGFDKWTVFDLDASVKFEANESQQGEYVLKNVNLAAGDNIQAVEVKDLVIKWYGATYYTVDAAHAGVKDIYFRPEGNTEWYEFGGFIYIADNGSATGIENAAIDGKAVKMIQNGQVVIIKGDKIYNIMGQLIR